METPYPGLRPFRKDERDIFKGRQEQIRKLYNRLIDNKNRFVAVIGASGCGKSSLVEAGLLPELDNNYSNYTWRVAKLKPGSRPIKKLTSALLHKDALAREKAGIENCYEYLYAKLKASSFGIIETIQETALPENTNLLIIVDQFEEIFRSMHYSDNNEVRAFVYLLIEAINKKDIPLYVLITMRSDFIGDCAAFYNFAELVGDNIFLVPRLKLKQLREIITLPAKEFGAIVEPSLVSKLINDMNSNQINDKNSTQDQLPVLQHALMQMWFESVKDKKTKTFTLDDYKLIGSLTSSLTKHADKIYDQLETNQQHTASILFKCLVEHSKNYGDMRRTITLTDAAQISMVNKKEIEIIVNIFSHKKCNFLTFSEDDKIIDISHESLIRQWKKLILWKNQEKDTASTYYELLRKEKENDFLVRLSLEKALNWKNGTTPNEYWSERYDQDLEQKLEIDKEQEEDKENEKYKEEGDDKKDEKIKSNYEKVIAFIEKSKRIEDNQRIKSRFFFASIFLTLSLIIITFYVYKTKKEQTINTNNLIQSYLKHASLKAKANNFDQAQSIINESKLLQNISSERFFTLGLIEWYFHYLSAEPLKKYRIKLERQIFPTSSAVSSDSHYIFIGTSNGKIIKYDLFAQKNIYLFTAHESPVTNIAIHPQNKWIVSSNNDGEIRFWSFNDPYSYNQWNIDDAHTDDDIASNQENDQFSHVDFEKESKVVTKTLKYIESDISFSMQLSQDGNLIAYGYDSIQIKNTDANADSITAESLYPKYKVDDIAFSHDSKHIAVASFNEVYIIQLNKKITRDGNTLRRIFRTNEGIIGLSFHPTDTLLSISTSSKTYIFDYRHKKYRYEIPAVESEITCAEFDQNGNLVTITLNKKIFVQNLNGLILKVLQGHKHAIVNWLQCNEFYFSIDRSGVINKWKIYAEKDIFSEQKKYDNEPLAVKISPDTSKCLIGFSNGNLTMKNLKKFETVWTCKMNHNIIDVAYSPDLNWVAHMNSAKELTIRSALNGNVKYNQKLKLSPSDCTFSPDSKSIAIAFEKGTFGIYSILNNRIQYFTDNNEINENEDFNSIAYNNSGDKLMTGSSNGFVKLWKSPDWKKHKEFSVSNDGMNFSIFRGNQPQFICGGMDHQLYLIYEESNMIVSILSHENEIVKAMLFPGNQQLLSVGNDRTLRLFDFPSNTELFRLKLPIEKFDYPVNDLDLCCVNDECVTAVALKNKIVFYKF